jgi:Pyruvate/2-oxoacid:ferredoxin oxidoreductase delta subunit
MCELFNPITYSWETGNTLNFKNSFFNSVLLDSDFVLVTGESKNCELYNPENNIFTIAADKQSIHRLYTLTKLMNGTVLLVGGLDSGGITNKCYLYLPDSTLTMMNETNKNIEYDYKLSQNFPNPFNPSTTINYSLPVSGFVQLKVFNLLGQEIANLVEKEQRMGNYEIDFNASGLTNGIYFYRLQSENFTETKKLILLR